MHLARAFSWKIWVYVRCQFCNNCEELCDLIHSQIFVVSYKMFKSQSDVIQLHGNYKYWTAKVGGNFLLETQSLQSQLRCHTQSAENQEMLCRHGAINALAPLLVINEDRVSFASEKGTGFCHQTVSIKGASALPNHEICYHLHPVYWTPVSATPNNPNLSQSYACFCLICEDSG